MSSELIIALCNSRSGGQQGPRVIAGLQQHLGENCVFDLSRTDPATAIRDFCYSGGNGDPTNFVGSLKIIVCGGDGTCGWVFTAIDRACENDAKVQEVRDRISICVMPLGTGNDLSRSLGWGKGFSSSMLRPQWINRVKEAEVIGFDRWQVSISPKDPDGAADKIPPAFSVVKYEEAGPDELAKEAQSGSESSNGSHRSSIVLTKGRTFSDAMQVGGDNNAAKSYEAIFTNYFSFGLDASVALEFHQKREEHPERFTSQLKNKLQYLRYGAVAGGACPCVRAPPPRLGTAIPTFTYRRKGEPNWTDLQLPRGTRAVIVLNLQSYAGGQNLWGRCDRRPSFSDGLLEVIALRSVWDMARIVMFNKLGSSAVRLCQACEVKMELNMATAMQIDGEPWSQSESTIHIRPFEVTNVLQAGGDGCCGCCCSSSKSSAGALKSSPPLSKDAARENGLSEV